MIPQKLFRFFKEKQYAEEFAFGKIRIGNMSVYKCIEDARKDETEGTSSFVWNQYAPEYLLDKTTLNIVGKTTSSTEKIKFEGTLINPLYLLCTSSLRVNKKLVAPKFGNFVVEINNPSGFLELLKQGWAKNTCSLNGKVQLKKVRYTRGNLVKPNKYLIPPSDISYTQKLLKYRDEYEYRFVFWCQIDPDIILKEFEYLDIGIDNNVIKKEVRVILKHNQRFQTDAGCRPRR